MFQTLSSAYDHRQIDLPVFHCPPSIVYEYKLIAVARKRIPKCPFVVADLGANQNRIGLSRVLDTQVGHCSPSIGHKFSGMVIGSVWNDERKV